ncbi:sulfurtransferase TusA family protein [Aliagarivorans marinus]|uniref:sulfurtransferase TusA family protein n=1 Tax=Aliagarivorans marinus TaxID=561965 RepID=UPI000A059551|nr:sulfurtransferase TusA family protein [Aliagarivorans marinus]
MPADLPSIHRHCCRPRIEQKVQDFDFREYVCPEPLIQSKLWLRDAVAGEQARIQLRDPGSCQDIPRFFRRLGHQVELAESSHGCQLIITIKGRVI